MLLAWRRFLVLRCAQWPFACLSLGREEASVFADRIHPGIGWVEGDMDRFCLSIGKWYMDGCVRNLCELVHQGAHIASILVHSVCPTASLVDVCRNLKRLWLGIALRPRSPVAVEGFDVLEGEQSTIIVLLSLTETSTSSSFRWMDAVLEQDIT